MLASDILILSKYTYVTVCTGLDDSLGAAECSVRSEFRSEYR